MNHYPPVHYSNLGAPSEQGVSGNGANFWHIAQPTREVTSGATTCPSIRVKIADAFRTPPPIDFKKYVFSQIQSGPIDFDFGFERKFLQEANEEVEDPNDPQPLLKTAQIVDPWEPRLRHFLEKGYQRDAICLALTLSPSDPDEKIEEFIKGYDIIRNMGFNPFHAAATLMHHRGNFQMALDTLLSEQAH